MKPYHRFLTELLHSESAWQKIAHWSAAVALASGALFLIDAVMRVILR